MTAVGAAPSVAERTAGWLPSRWGPDDEAGALNELTPAVVVAAVGLVRTGHGHDLAHGCTPICPPSPAAPAAPT